MLSVTTSFPRSPWLSELLVYMLYVVSLPSRLARSLARSPAGIVQDENVSPFVYKGENDFFFSFVVSIS